MRRCIVRPPWLRTHETPDADELFGGHRWLEVILPARSHSSASVDYEQQPDPPVRAWDDYSCWVWEDEP
jgi:hypothetical protein